MNSTVMLTSGKTLAILEQPDRLAMLLQRARKKGEYASLHLVGAEPVWLHADHVAAVVPLRLADSGS